MRQNTPNIPPIAPVSALRLSYQPQNIDRIDLALNLFQQPAKRFFALSLASCNRLRRLFAKDTGPNPGSVLSGEQAAQSDRQSSLHPGRR